MGGGPNENPLGFPAQTCLIGRSRVLLIRPKVDGERACIRAEKALSPSVKTRGVDGTEIERTGAGLKEPRAWSAPIGSTDRFNLIPQPDNRAKWV